MTGKWKWQTTREGQRGFSLVEILVAAILLSLVVVAMIAMVQKGREMEISSDHRRQARAYIHAVFEEKDFQFANYMLMGPAMNRQDTVRLDRDESTPLTAYRTVTVATEKTMNIGPGATIVPYKDVTVKVVWSEPEHKDSVSVFKRISNAK